MVSNNLQLCWCQISIVHMTWLPPGVNLWPHQLAAVLPQDRKKVSHKGQVSLPGEAGWMDQQTLLVSLSGPLMFSVKILLSAIFPYPRQWNMQLVFSGDLKRRKNANSDLLSRAIFRLSHASYEIRPVGRFAGWSLKWVVLVKSLNGFEGKCLMERFWTYQDQTDILCEATSDILPCRFSLESSNW